MNNILTDPTDSRGDVHIAWLDMHGLEYLPRIPKPIKKQLLLTDSSKVLSYFITLTTTVDDVKPLQTTIHKILNSSQYNIKKYVYSYELTKSGLPHVHMLCYTNSYIKSREIYIWNRQERVDVQLVKSINSVRNYILKIKSQDEIDYFNYNLIDPLVVWSSESDSEVFAPHIPKSDDS